MANVAKSSKSGPRARLRWNDLDDMVATGVARCTVEQVTVAADGTEAVTILGTAEVHRDKLSAANLARATMHGLKQRAADPAAIMADSSGLPPTAGQKLAAVRRMAEHLESGSTEWNLRPSRDPLAGKSPEELAALRDAIIARLATQGIAR